MKIAKLYVISLLIWDPISIGNPPYRAINEYEDALGRYIPVLMAQAKIYWDLEMYQQVRPLFLTHTQTYPNSEDRILPPPPESRLLATRSPIT